MGIGEAGISRTQKPDLLEGSRIRKRGYRAEGVVIKAKGTTRWIEWDDGTKARERPVMCHVMELEDLGGIE